MSKIPELMIYEPAPGVDPEEGARFCEQVGRMIAILNEMDPARMSSAATSILLSVALATPDPVRYATAWCEHSIAALPRLMQKYAEENRRKAS